MSKFKTYALNIGLVCFGLLIGLACLEIALEVLRYSKRGSEFDNLADLRKAMLTAPELGKHKNVNLGDIVLPHVDDQLIYTLKPNLDLTFMRARVRTNSFGMRGPEITIEKPQNTYRIALLGDSFAFGWGVEENESFSAVLERNLNRMFKGNPRFEVLNFAVPGYSTFQEARMFHEKALCFDPDAVLLYFVENDFGLPFFMRDIRSSKTGGLFSALEFSRLTWSKTNEDAQEELVKLQGWDPNTTLDKLARATEERGIPFFYTINPKKAQKKILSRLPSLRKRSSVHFMELREGLLRAMKSRSLDAKALTLSFDPHPSPIRHEILGDLMTPHFWAAVDQER